MDGSVLMGFFDLASLTSIDTVALLSASMAPPVDFEITAGASTVKTLIKEDLLEEW